MLGEDTRVHRQGTHCRYSTHAGSAFKSDGTHYGTFAVESRGGLMVSTQVCQSEGSGFKSRSGQIAYFHGVKTRLSTLGTGDVVPRGSDST